MPKRARSHESSRSPAPKRQRHVGVDRLSTLSDELLLRILSFLPVLSLVLVQRISIKFHAIGGDDQLWKAAYYDRFVLPRALRLPGIKELKGHNGHLTYSAKRARWLDDGYLTKRGANTEWKRQYKLRHNWTQGKCSVSEIPVSETRSSPPLLLRYWNGIVFTADALGGLRAWSSKPARELLCALALHAGLSRSVSGPTALALDECERAQSPTLSTLIAVGFEDGSYGIYSFMADVNCFTRIYRHARSSNGPICAIALSYPYLVTMTESRTLAVYSFAVLLQPGTTAEAVNVPSLVYSLRSSTASMPLSLSIRRRQDHIVASVAYTLTTYLAGYSVGIQELRLSLDGILLESRYALSEDRPFHGLRTPSYAYGASDTDRNFSSPTSLSYTHPYLLVAHPDNTLTLYLVTSSLSSLSISAGSRLWGHTSSVSGAHVGIRGRAISVSSDELRVWELEGSTANKKRLSSGKMSIRLNPEPKAGEGLDTLNAAIARRGTGLGLALEYRETTDLTSTNCGWVGFDEENVVVLREKREGKQALIVYDFT